MLFVLQQFHEFFKVKKLALIGQKFLIWNTAEARTQFCAIFNLNFHLQFVLQLILSRFFKRWQDQSLQNIFYNLPCLSRDRIFSFLFLQNFLRILRPRFWVCSAVSLALRLLCARNLNFDEICLDLSGTMCTKKLRSKFMSKTLSLMSYLVYYTTL